MSEKNKHLNARLNKIIGQVNAIKKQIDKAEPDCLETIHLVKAANNALRKFAELYVNEYFETCLAKRQSSSKNKEKDNELANSMKDIIRSAFTV